MSRPRTDLGEGAEETIRELAARGLSGREIAARLLATGCTVSVRTIERRLAEVAPDVRAARAESLASVAQDAPVEEPAPIAPPSGPEAPLTPAERQVDALLARSPVWRRIQGAIASALAAHPAAAAAVARALREVSL